MRRDCQRYGCECLLPAEECPGQIKGRLRRRPPSEGRAIQLLVIVHCFMVRGIYNS